MGTTVNLPIGFDRPEDKSSELETLLHFIRLFVTLS